MSNATDTTPQEVINHRAEFVVRAWLDLYGDEDITTYEQMTRSFQFPDRDQLCQYAYITADEDGIYHLFPYRSWETMLEEGVGRMFDDDPQFPRYVLDLDNDEAWIADATIFLTRANI